MRFKFGIFSESLKTAKVVLTYKQVDMIAIVTYKPISVFFKLLQSLEKLICKRTHTFLDKDFIFMLTQY